MRRARSPFQIPKPGNVHLNALRTALPNFHPEFGESRDSRSRKPRPNLAGPESAPRRISKPRGLRAVAIHTKARELARCGRFLRLKDFALPRKRRDRARLARPKDG